jgi:hypothetical protein
MLFELKMPKLNDNMDTGLIETAYGAEGSALKLGSKLLDISVDLSRAFSQNCPPVSYYRLVLRETLWLRSLAAPGTRCTAGERIALFSNTPDEPIDGPVAREARVLVAGINVHDEMFSRKATV